MPKDNQVERVAFFNSKNIKRIQDELTPFVLESLKQLHII